MWRQVAQARGAPRVHRQGLVQVSRSSLRTVCIGVRYGVCIMREFDLLVLK
jgi:hypothetical protein